MGRLGGVPNEIPGGSDATGLIGAGYDRDLSCGDSAAAACRTSPLAWAAPIRLLAASRRNDKATGAARAHPDPARSRGTV